MRTKIVEDSNVSVASGTTAPHFVMIFNTYSIHKYMYFETIAYQLF